MSRFIWWVFAGVWMGGIWWLSDQPELSSGLEADFVLRKLAHMFEFGVLTYVLYRACAPRSFSGAAMLAAVAGALLYAALDEWHQTWVAGRTGTIRDVAIDLLGILLAAAVIRRTS